MPQIRGPHERLFALGVEVSILRPGKAKLSDEALAGASWRYKLKVRGQGTVGASSRPAAMRFPHGYRERVELVEELRLS